MLVYRVCDTEEYNVIMKEHSINNIGDFYNNNSYLSDHRYIPNVRYIHFFEKLADVTLWFSFKGFLICTYDIDEEILKKFKGVGRYNERLGFKGLESANEYAVPSNLVDFECLVKVQKILETLLYEDFFDDSYKKLLLTIYDETGPLLERKGSN